MMRRGLTCNEEPSLSYLQDAAAAVVAIGVGEEAAGGAVASKAVVLSARLLVSSPAGHTPTSKSRRHAWQAKHPFLPPLFEEEPGIGTQQIVFFSLTLMHNCALG
uniref:Uncharacterized protein n=1 Tax=Ditylenchus dipsaci TaxID=166011 RepID=A0A915DRY4_9BILA